MSGEDIPYQLRPNKFIDRRMFVELLSRLIVPRGVENYIYVSMGGRHLVDHSSVYNQLGIDALYSFDLNGNAVARQKFNRPTGAMVCNEMNSADLPSQVDSIMSKFPRKRNLIVWLDYTSTARRSQLQEAVQTLARLKHGDVFRITLNASFNTLGDNGNWKGAGATGPGEYRADQLRKQIPEFLPTDVTVVGADDFPLVLARCVALATNAAEALRPGLHFTPVLITSYKDGARMFTATCVVTEAGNSEVFPKPSFRRWKFAASGWDSIQYIYAPLLSAKEQYRLDENLQLGPTRMLSKLRFLPAEDKSSSVAALRSYKAFHRFYPTFRHVED
jgi:hypothetical protein